METTDVKIDYRLARTIRERKLNYIYTVYDGLLKAYAAGDVNNIIEGLKNHDSKTTEALLDFFTLIQKFESTAETLIRLEAERAEAMNNLGVIKA